MADPHIYLVAGEPSGDALGARLMKALKARGVTRFSGIGGWGMQAEGLTSLFPMEDLSVMGLAEVLPKLTKLIRRIRQTADDIINIEPDIVVTIDAPDFSFRVAKAVREKAGANAPKLVHYVAPTVWAWRAGRARKIAEYLDGLICLFDFEPPYFEREGLRSAAVGHPVAEKGAMEADGSVYRDEVGITRSEMSLGILMGSRVGEVRRVGPVLADAARRVAESLTDPPHLIVPTLPHVQDAVWDKLKNYPGPVHFTTGFDLKWPAFKAMDAAMAVSGTVGLELAVTGVPHLIAYKMNPISYAIVNRAVEVDHAHLVNIMMGREVVPEFIQDKADPQDMAECVLDLLSQQRLRQAQLNAFAQVRQRIGAGEAQTPSQKAADFVLSFLDPRR